MPNTSPDKPEEHETIELTSICAASKGIGRCPIGRVRGPWRRWRRKALRESEAWPLFVVCPLIRARCLRRRQDRSRR
jgi:hypothetical protein